MMQKQIAFLFLGRDQIFPVRHRIARKPRICHPTFPRVACSNRARDLGLCTTLSSSPYRPLWEIWEVTNTSVVVKLGTGQKKLS